MTSALGSKAATDPRPPLVVTGRRLNEILDARDEAMVANMDKFRVEVVERLGEMARMQDKMQDLIVQAISVIKVNNIHQPQAESIEVKYLVPRGDPAFLYETSADGAAQELAAGGTYYRDVTIREMFKADETAVRDAREVVTQLRSLTR